MLDSLYYSLKLAAVIAGFIAIVPLMVWGGSGNWRHAVQALKEYASILGWAFALVGGFALVMVAMERIG